MAKRGTLRVAGCAAAVLALAAALWQMGPQRPRSTGAPAHVLRRGNGSEPETLDPHLARSEAALTVLRDLYEGLIALGADDNPVLAAADAYVLSDDGRTYRFHLRPGLKWSNGERLVAEDFAAAWRRLVDPRTGAQYADLLRPVRGAQAITHGAAAPATLGVFAEDDQHLRVELENPTPYFLRILSHPATFPLNRPSLAAHGRGFAKPGVLVSNGAFVLTRWDFGSHLVAVRNHAYWNDRATRLEGVEYYSYADPAMELNAFRAGELDITNSIPPAQFVWVQQHLGPALHVAPQLAVYYLGLNLRKSPLAESPALRQALSLVIDRERLVQSVTGTGEMPAYSFVPAQVPGYSPAVPEYARQPLARRVATARRLLADAGMAARPPTLELRYNSSELHSRIAVAVAHMWQESLGVRTRLVAEEFKVLLQDIDRGDVVQVFRASWIADFADPCSFLQVLQGGSGINLSRYANPRYDELLSRAAADPDVSDRRLLLQRAEAIMLADQPVIPLFFYVSKHLVSAGIQGWRDSALNVVYTKNLSKTVPAAR